MCKEHKFGKRNYIMVENGVLENFSCIDFTWWRGNIEFTLFLEYRGLNLRILIEKMFLEQTRDRGFVCWKFVNTTQAYWYTEMTIFFKR